MDQKNAPVLIGIIVLIIILVLGAGFFVYQYLTPKNNQLPANNQPIPCTQDAKICEDGSSVSRVSPTCEFAPCPPVTTGWKTYTSKDYGFEMKYPKNWYFGPNMALCSAKNYSLKTGCTAKAEISLGISKKPAEKTIGQIGMQNCSRIEQRSVNGITIQVRYCSIRGMQAIWLDKSGSNAYVLQLTDNSQANIFSQIVSTVKFTK